MSIQLSVQAPGLNIAANVRDDALAAIIQLIQDNRDDTPPQLNASPTAPTAAKLPGFASMGTAASMTAHNNEHSIKDHLKAHGAAELLNILKWESFPEKILLLGAWNEARGGNTPWRSADMDDTFRQAKESGPRNFPRDIKNAIKSGWIHAETPRTYAVTRSGWNRIGHAIEGLQQ